MGINTGEMVKVIREEKYDKGETGETRANRVAMVSPHRPTQESCQQIW